MNETTTYNSSIGNLIEPEIIGYSFNTPGWNIVFGLLVITALIIVFLQYRKYRKNAYRREAIKQVEEILQKKSDNVVFEINTLLKRMAIQLFGRRKVAALYGLEWFEFLVSTSTIPQITPSENFHMYSNAIYNNSYTLDEAHLKELADFAIIWIKNHRTNNV